MSRESTKMLNPPEEFPECRRANTCVLQSCLLSAAGCSFVALAGVALRELTESLLPWNLVSQVRCRNRKTQKMKKSKSE